LPFTQSLIPVTQAIDFIGQGQTRSSPIAWKIQALSPFTQSSMPVTHATDVIVQGETRSCQIARKITRVIEGVQKNRHDLVSLLLSEEVPLPTKFEEIHELRPGAHPLVIISDFEPDDILAILMMRQRRPGPLPVVIQIADLSWKDKGGILAKKMVLAATALGRTFAERLVVLDGTDQDPSQMAKARELLQEQLEASNGVAPEWMFLAPGRGHLTELMKDAQPAPCHIYSGSYNTRLPQMTKMDVEAIRRVAAPIYDSAQFVFTKDHAGLKSLNKLWPELGDDVLRWNSSCSEAWRQFSDEFDAMLINPGHPGLFFKPDKDADPLTTDERSHFNNRVAPLFGDPSAPGAETRRYAEALAEAPYFSKVVGFKQPTVQALATGTLDGPLCDVLVPLSDWLRNEGGRDQSVEVKTGLWSLNPDRGFTKILPMDAPMAPKMANDVSDGPVEGVSPNVLGNATMDPSTTEMGLCEGTMVALRNPADETANIKVELLAAIEEMMALS